MSLRFLLSLAGGLEILAGVAALVIPGPVLSLLLGGSADPIASMLARLFGAGGAIGALALGWGLARLRLTCPGWLSPDLNGNE